MSEYWAMKVELAKKRAKMWRTAAILLFITNMIAAIQLIYQLTK